MEQLTQISLLDRIDAAWSAWASGTDPTALLYGLVALAVVMLLRGPLAALATKGIVWLFGTMSIEIPEKMRTEVTAALRVIIVVVAALFTLDALKLPELFGGVIYRILISVLVMAVFAAWYRLIEPFVAGVDPKKFSDVALDTSWVVRLSQFVVVILGISAVLAVWEIDISSALTGVGVFGAGLAIAAQDFVRNLFAGMANMSEKRFGPGDWIAVEGGIEGIVTRVDVRSTTVLGFDRVPSYIPNSELSNSTVQNKSRMDHRRILWTIPLVLGATDAQVEQVCAGVQAHLDSCGDFVDDGSALLIAVPTGLSEVSLDIMVCAFTRTTDYPSFLAASARLTLAVRRVIADAGTELAYPTQTVYLGAGARGEGRAPVAGSDAPNGQP